MSRHLAIEWATAEGARSRMRVSHMLFPPLRVWPRETSLTGRGASARSALPHTIRAFHGAQPRCLDGRYRPCTAACHGHTLSGGAGAFPAVPKVTAYLASHQRHNRGGSRAAMRVERLGVKSDMQPPHQDPGQGLLPARQFAASLLLSKHVSSQRIASLTPGRAAIWPTA
jgi:hypothetical protein